ESAVRRVEEILCHEMEQVLGDVPAAVESALSTRWDKRAKLLVRNGKVYPWAAEEDKRDEVRRTNSLKEPRPSSEVENGKAPTPPPEETPTPVVRAESPASGPLKWHGGKSYLAGRIVKMMPQHTQYVEPFAGGLAVLLAKEPEGVSEVVNDLHRDLT